MGTQSMAIKPSKKNAIREKKSFIPGEKYLRQYEIIMQKYTSKNFHLLINDYADDEVGVSLADGKWQVYYCEKGNKYEIGEYKTIASAINRITDVYVKQFAKNRLIKLIMKRCMQKRLPAYRSMRSFNA